MNLDQICAGLTLDQRNELFQIVTSYVESIDKSFTSTLDVVCIGCASGLTRKLTYSKTNGTRCATCKAQLSTEVPKITETPLTKFNLLPHTVTLCSSSSGDVGGGQDDFTKVEIPATLTYDPNVTTSSSSLGRGQFLKPGGL